jgi:hypothetical protein
VPLATDFDTCFPPLLLRTHTVVARCWKGLWLRWAVSEGILRLRLGCRLFRSLQAACSRSSGTSSLRTALPLCRTRVRPPAWCRSSRSSATCDRIGGVLSTAYFAHSHRSSP